MNTRVEAAWAALEELTDPEIPVISLRELGILRDVRQAADGLATLAPVGDPAVMTPPIR